jgi:predicted ATPase
LRRHDDILREEIERRRGYVFKTIGDAFCAAFWTVGEALAAAVDVQRRLGREDFARVDGLPVRIAIDAGETDERAGDYFGPAVNRTARLLSACHGGQILLSGFAADLATASLPAGITLRHLGVLPLRGLKEPQRVYQPIVPELRSDFKPLRALETPPNNLPRQTTSFVGRSEEIARVEALLQAGPLVTVVGAGGIGKTRLALEVAASRLNDERDGVWLVDLASITNASLIAEAILSALRAERQPDVESLDALLSYLEKRELLLLLDNSEHLISEVAATVAQVVARCAHVSVLATSREPLDISGERIYRLASLDLASTMQLFNDRALAVDPGFRSDAKAAVVEEICERLDGIALAVELAAARVRTMSVENLAAHLELRTLAGGRDRRPRQQTMRALIGWSYDLLDDEEQRVLRRSAVFLRGFTLGVALEVCGTGDADEARILDVLAALVDKSLVVAELAEPDQRYRLLEPIREYAWEKLAEAGEAPDAKRRHAAAFASLARRGYEEWEMGPLSDWLTRLERDLANFRVALRWSLEEKNDPALGTQVVADATPAFLRLSLLAEGIEYCELALQDGAALPNALEARLRYGLSMLYSNVGANKKVLEQARRAVALYREAGEQRGLAHALSQVASRYASLARWDEAKAAAEEALALARGIGDRRLLADALRRCAAAFAADGNDEVRERYEESVAIFRSLGRNDETARALFWWAQWEAECANYGGAVERFLEARKLAGPDLALALASDIASCYLAMDDRSKAEPIAREALTLALKVRHPVYAPLAVLQLAAVASERDPCKAAHLVGYAEEGLHAAGWELVPPETTILENVYGLLKRALPEAKLTRLRQESASWDEAQAVACALSPSST